MGYTLVSRSHGGRCRRAWVQQQQRGTLVCTYFPRLSLIRAEAFARALRAAPQGCRQRESDEHAGRAYDVPVYAKEARGQDVEEHVAYG